MRTIWKWRLIDWSGPRELRDRPTLKMPFGARVLCVQEQDGDVCVWAEIRTNERPLVERHFIVVGTGNEVPHDALRYIGTWQRSSDGNVFHLYEAP